MSSLFWVPGPRVVEARRPGVEENAKVASCAIALGDFGVTHWFAGYRFE
jgi:hypothetical protein